MSSNSHPRPPFGLRLAASLFRRVPPIRGRERLERIGHKLLRGNGLTDHLWVKGIQLEVSLDDLAGRTLYLDGVIERASTEAIQTVLKPGSTVFDVGANMGYYTLLFARLTGDGGKVIAFEPVPETATRLYQNLGLNPILAKNVRVFEMALSDNTGTVLINVSGPGNTGASHVATPSPAIDAGRTAAAIVRTISVATQSGDAIWHELGRPKVDLLKLDIEGHEPHALRGMKELLASQTQLLVFAEVRSSFLKAAGESRESLFAFMKALGYGSYEFRPEDRSFQHNDSPRDGELIIFARDNTLCLKPIS